MDASGCVMAGKAPRAIKTGTCLVDGSHLPRFMCGGGGELGKGLVLARGAYQRQIHTGSKGNLPNIAFLSLILASTLFIISTSQVRGSVTNAQYPRFGPRFHHILS